MHYRFLLIGGTAVGKTSWLQQIIEKKYNEKYTPSLIPRPDEIDYKNYTLSCIDMPGISIDKHIVEEYDIDGIFLMCDMTGKGLDNLKKWKKTLDQIYPNVKYILIINKLDIDVDEEIDFDNFCKGNNIHSLHAISVKDNHAIMEPIDSMIELIQEYKTIKIFKPTESDNFIKNLLVEMEKCFNDTDIKVKIKYILLLCSVKHVQNNINQLITDINKLFMDNKSMHDILNYIIMLY